MLRLSSLIVFAIVLVLFSSPIRAQDYDFEAVDLRVVPVGSLFNVTPVINLSVAGTFPAQVVLEYQLFVNDVLVGTNSAHTVSLLTDCEGFSDTPQTCSGACSVLIHDKPFPGTCSGTLPDDCFCKGKYTLWPLEDVAIPDGATCRLVLDPNNLVTEIDETNNEVIILGPDHPIPATSEWGLVVLTLMGMALGTIIIRRKLGTAVA